MIYKNQTEYIKTHLAQYAVEHRKNQELSTYLSILYKGVEPSVKLHKSNITLQQLKAMLSLRILNITLSEDYMGNGKNPDAALGILDHIFTELEEQS